MFGSVRCTMCRLMLLMILMVGRAVQQQINDCPDPWIPNADSCYQFVDSRDRTYQEAAIFCVQSYSTLISINSDVEHLFVQDWLSRRDSKRQDWFTSGRRDKDNNLVWDSDGSKITNNYFKNPGDIYKEFQDVKSKIKLNQIVYRVVPETQNEYRWAWSRLLLANPFICEINKQDVWKLYQQKRDFSYGTNITDPNHWLIGPNITYQSRGTVFFEFHNTMTSVSLDCQATGNPIPTSRWYRKSASSPTIEWITSDLNSRYSVTSGRLTITNPNPSLDVSTYTCVATNSAGTVKSNPIDIYYGYVSEFSNVAPSPIQATKYWGKEITCQPPIYNPDLSFQWFKNTVFNFIRPDKNPQYFLSRNGNLYISEVQAADQDLYYCAIFLAPKSGQVLANSQPPSRTSMGIQVNVAGESANTYGPDIQDKFPQYFPSVPMVGGQVDIECLAYGRLPLAYSWVRDDGPLHPEAYYKDHNRVLTIPRARLEDTGSYTCVVKGERNTMNKTVFMTLQAEPSFPLPLQNQHLDIGSKLTWICSAIGNPLPVYTWYRNGEVLGSKPSEGITVYRNILTIEKLDAATHNAMYECEASNSFGIARSSAQLRVLAFPPTFARNPVPGTKQGAERGNTTIQCRPEAAPRATIRWTKNGQELDKVSPNGDLQLSFLAMSDAGVYTCTAENSLGQATSSCSLAVLASAVFTELPPAIQVGLNETASLQCKASFDQIKSDAVYSWRFNDHIIDFSGANSEDYMHYSMPYAQNQFSGMLYIISAQYGHEGTYTCIVSTVTGSIEAQGYVTVKGPPGEPGGIHIPQSYIQGLAYNDVHLWWQPGETHSYEIQKYAIEFQTEDDDLDDHKWYLLVGDIPEQSTHIDQFPEWRVYVITSGLSPGTIYRFRLRAGNNQVGYGPPSGVPSIWYTMLSAAPAYSPENVGGGGGSVGILHIQWDPLPRSRWGSATIFYNIHFRQKSESVNDGQWISILKLTDTAYNYLVGLDFYYTSYEVKVQAENEIGKGPNSSVVIVYSAEDMPSNVAPKFVQAMAINGTAGIVEWEPIPDKREMAKGTVLAYQVNYWLEGDTTCKGKYEDTARFVRFYGNVSSGLIIGMEPTLDYCLNLQFLNHAGLGPKTDNYYLGMNFAPPSKYPEFVTVASHGNDSVRLFWRGVSVIWGEEPLIGYKAWWWDIREDIRTAKVASFGKTSTGVVHGVHRGVVYKLRLMGYSIGGDGKKSQDVYFTLGGEVPIDPTTTEIINHSPMLLPAPLCVLLLVLFVIHHRLFIGCV